MNATKKCPRCKGRGHIEEDGSIYNCPDCDGTGLGPDSDDDDDFWDNELTLHRD